jgi:hypothetical protein
MASGKETFQWKTCHNPDHGQRRKKHKIVEPKQRMDCPETMVTLGLDNPTLFDQTCSQDDTDDDILDASLLRGGSSLSNVRAFDQNMMEEALEVSQPDFASSDGNTSEGEETETETEEARDAPLVVAEPELAAEKPDTCELAISIGQHPSNIGATFLKSAAGNLSTNGPKSSLGGKLKSAVRKSPQGSTAGPSTKAKGLRIDISDATPFPLRRNPCPRKPRSRSPRKKTAQRKGKSKMDENDNNEQAENKEPLTAHSIIQQVSQMMTTSLILGS